MSNGGALRFVTFRVDQRLYALPTEVVSEVIRVPSFARVPQAPPALLGVANLRGSVLPLASLRGLLGIAEAGALVAPRALVLDGGAPVAIAVDGVDALVTIQADRLNTRQAELSARPGERLTGAFQDGGSVAKVLDIQGLLEAAFARRALPQTRDETRAAIVAAGSAGVVEAEVLVTFDVAGQEYGLALDSVQEIVSAPDAVTTMPRAEAPVVGVMAFRDQLLPLLSLRGLLGHANATDSDGREKILVTSIGGAPVGLIADRARAIVSAERRLVDPIPSMLAARTGGEARIKAIYRGEGGRRLVSILAPEQLFREDVMQRLGAVHQPATSPIANPGQVGRMEAKFLVFRLGDDEFGLPVDAVDEVARVHDQITRVPKAPGFLEGLVNLRGDVVPVIDQRRRFGMPKLEDANNRRLIVVRTQGHRAALIVDGVSEVLRSFADAVKATPSLTDEASRLVSGVINLGDEDRIVLVLDPTELLTQAERKQLDAFAPDVRSQRR